MSQCQVGLELPQENCVIGKSYVSHCFSCVATFCALGVVVSHEHKTYFLYLHESDWIFKKITPMRKQLLSVTKHLSHQVTKVLRVR